MKKKNAGAGQVNQYDKILRENLEAALPGLTKNLLGIHAVYTEELPDDIQYTKERKPDVLKKITDKTGETFVLHIEFQLKDEPEMAFRMAEYYIMLLRRYKLPVQQYVIYIGKGIPKMTDTIVSARMHFTYALTILSTIDYNLLLASDTPEGKMLAILADLGKANPRRAVEDIVKQVIANSQGDFSKLRRIKQLRIMGQLRNLAPENLAIMDDITGFFTKEKDIFYILGERDGMEKGKQDFVRNLLLNTDFSIVRIASLANVSQFYVRKIKKTLPSLKHPLRTR
ncbi:MAG TPA: hypothetical protein VHW43_02425 [Puia sp.]|nr:hypothetical protein [Puia sp.]